MDIKDIRNGKGGWMKAKGRRWDPEEGEHIIGVYLRTERHKSSDKKKEFLRYIIKNQEGLEIIVLGTTILDDLFKDVPIGHEVCIIFTGTQHNKPPIQPTKLFEVFHRPVSEDNVAQNDQQNKKNHNSPTLNTHDPGEVGIFIQGVEQELQDKNMELIELNMLSEAKDQIGNDDPQFWKLVKDEIIKRDYPVKMGGS